MENFEELDKKNKKTKISLITELAIIFKSKYISAFNIQDIQVIFGEMPMYLKPEYINYKYTTLGYIVMLIISIIS